MYMMVFLDICVDMLQDGDRAVGNRKGLSYISRLLAEANYLIYSTFGFRWCFGIVSKP